MLSRRLRNASLRHLFFLLSLLAVLRPAAGVAATAKDSVQQSIFRLTADQFAEPLLATALTNVARNQEWQELI